MVARYQAAGIRAKVPRGSKPVAYSSGVLRMDEAGPASSGGTESIPAPASLIPPGHTSASPNIVSSMGFGHRRFKLMMSKNITHLSDVPNISLNQNGSHSRSARVCYGLVEGNMASLVRVGEKRGGTLHDLQTGHRLLSMTHRPMHLCLLLAPSTKLTQKARGRDG